MKIMIIFLLLPFIVVSTVFGGSKVYTNKDLQRYQSRVLQSSLNVNASKISIDFVDANLYQVLQMIAEVAKGKDGVTIFVAPELSGTVTVKSADVPWTDILEDIVRKHHLSVLSLGKKTLLIYGRG
jgi:type II secretory pathway component HofQ